VSYAFKLAGIGIAFVVAGMIGILLFGALWARIGFGVLLFFAWRQDQKARESRAGLERI